MNIIFDVMSGDTAPGGPIRAAALVSKKLNVSVTLVGVEEIIKRALATLDHDNKKITICNAAEVIAMRDNPIEAIKKKVNSSMIIGLRLLAQNEGDAFVSAGNTGALVAGATLIIKRIQGIRRAALATVLPVGKSGLLLLDVGANVECIPVFLKQFGIMGSLYMNKVFNVAEPRVGLVNIGEEEIKGTALTMEANQLLKNASINYIGNFEPRDIPFDKADVAVCDGFTGNIMLKLLEGSGAYFSELLKDFFTSNFLSKLAALSIKNKIRQFRNKNNYSKYGGAPLLGISKVVIKAHGSSDYEAFFNAVRQAQMHVSSGVIDEIQSLLVPTLRNK